MGYGVQFNGSDAYPDADAIEANYADRVGEWVHLWMIVAGGEDGETVVVANDLRLRVTDPPPSAVESGDQVQVVGRLAPDRRLGDALVRRDPPWRASATVRRLRGRLPGRRRYLPPALAGRPRGVGVRAAMTDLLTHVLVAYAGAAVVAETTGTPDRLVPAAMVGAVLPDLLRVTVPLSVAQGEVAGVPYSTWGIHTLGGVVVLAGLGAMTVRAPDRRPTFGTLVAGGGSHLLLDLLVVRVDGNGSPYLFPLTDWLPPAGNVYTSADLWPLAVAGAVAVPVWLYRRRESSVAGTEE